MMKHYKIFSFNGKCIALTSYHFYIKLFFMFLLQAEDGGMENIDEDKSEDAKVIHKIYKYIILINLFLISFPPV